MNRSQIVALANAVQAIRPDWQQPGIIAALSQLDQGWPGTDAALSAHALTVAGNPTANTPQAVNAMPPAQTPAQFPAAGRGQWGRGPVCFICGRYRSQCETMRDHEIRHGIADPHDFETAEDAERNAVSHPTERKAIGA